MQDIFDSAPMEPNVEVAAKANPTSLQQSNHHQASLGHSAQFGHTSKVDLAGSVVRDEKANLQGSMFGSQQRDGQPVVSLAQDMSYKDGHYSGDVVNNVPHGSGTFIT